MPRGGAKGIAGYAGRSSETCEGWESEEGVEMAVWYDVEIEVNPSVVVKDKIPDDIFLLNLVRVGSVN
jgi:hypothetical protein